MGICSIIKPQLNFNSSLDALPFWSKLFRANDNVRRGSEVGKANGLTVLLDAETFDYTYTKWDNDGFIVSVGHHADVALLYFTGIMIK